MFTKSHRVLGVGLAAAVALAACAPGTTVTAEPAPSATSVTVTETTPPASPATTQAPASTTTQVATIEAVSFRQQMRRLWVDHVAWTRSFIVSASADLADTEVVAGRLLQNQADIGAAVAGFYGEEAGTALTGLLQEHILIAADLLTAAKAGDNQAVGEANTAWYENADEISAFLAGANPPWPKETLREMMYGHLDQTLAEATAQLTGDYQASVAEYDHIVTHILEMADALSAGIITQFPDRFAG